MYNLWAGQRHNSTRDTEERQKDTMEDDGEKDEPKKHQKM
jgi:hypothetical protein